MTALPVSRCSRLWRSHVHSLQMAMCIPLHRELVDARRRLKEQTDDPDRKRLKKRIVSPPARLLSVLRHMVDESADTTIELSMRDGNAIDSRWRDASVDLF